MMDENNKKVKLPKEISKYLSSEFGDKIGDTSFFGDFMQHLLERERYIEYFKEKYGQKDYMKVLMNCLEYGWENELETYYLVLPNVTGELSSGVN